MHIGKTGEFPALSQLRGLELKGEVGALAGASDVEAVSDSRNGQGFRFVGPVDKLTISREARNLAQQSKENPYHALVERERHRQMSFKAGREERRATRAKENLDVSRTKILGTANKAQTDPKERNNVSTLGRSKKSERGSTALLEKRAQLRANAAQRKREKPLFEARGPLAEKHAEKNKKPGEDFEPGPFIELEGEREQREQEEFELPGTPAPENAQKNKLG